MKCHPAIESLYKTLGIDPAPIDFDTASLKLAYETKLTRIERALSNLPEEIQ